MESRGVGVHPYSDKTIMALDQSTVSSGYAVFRYGSLEEYGVVNVNDNFDIFDKVRANYDQFLELYKKWKPDLLVLEDFVARNKKGALSNGNVVGAIILAFRPCPIVKFGNAEWKKGILGKNPKTSEEQKEMVRQKVNQVWGIDLKPEQYDISDAVGILTHTLQNPVKIPKIRYI